MRKKLVHHHYLYYGVVGRDMGTGETTRQLLEEFLSGLVVFLQIGKETNSAIIYDHINNTRVGKSYDGSAHIIFRYFLGQNAIQLDTYSAAFYDKEHIKGFCDSFRSVQKNDFLSISKHNPIHPLSAS